MRRKVPIGYQQNVLTALVVGAVVVGLSVLNWHLLQRSIDISPLSDSNNGEIARIDTRSDNIESTQATVASDYPQTLARPLFFANRRPPTQEKRTATKSKPKPKSRSTQNQPKGLKLVGIMFGKHQERRALLRSKAMPTGNWFEEGDVLEGWRVSKIDDSSITIVTGSKHLTLLLFPRQNE